MPTLALTSGPRRRTSLAWRLGTLALAISPLAAAPALAQEKQITANDVVTGTMHIVFNTRTDLDKSNDLVKGSPAIGAKDQYEVDLNVAKTTAFTGNITRQPNLYTRTLHRQKQSAQVFFNLNIVVVSEKDPNMKRSVGKWVGTVPIDTASGAYQLAGGASLKPEPSPLRISIENVGRIQAFTDDFGGKLVGKAEKKEGLATYTYKRLVAGKTQELKVNKIDPMKFENIELARGPRPDDPHVVVNGRLDYDYETGNWLTEGITFAYSVDGKEYSDVVTGSIKWIEDKDRNTSGKGHYEFNLRFNEEKNKTGSGAEDPAFQKLSGDDLFFAVDPNVPTLTGNVDFADTFGSDYKTTVDSKITYHLNANKLTKPQVMNFMKLWVICVGPTNDD